MSDSQPENEPQGRAPADAPASEKAAPLTGLEQKELVNLFAPPPAAPKKPKKKGWFSRKRKGDDQAPESLGNGGETDGQTVAGSGSAGQNLDVNPHPAHAGVAAQATPEGRHVKPEQPAPMTNIVGFGQVPAPIEAIDPEALVHLRKLHRVLFQPDSSPLHILRGVDLKIFPGEHVAIVGRSGTGKTTLLNQLGMLDLPSAGEYHLRGVDALRLSEAKRAELRGNNVGFVFQQFNLFEARTAVENVAVPLLYTSGKTFWQRNQIAAEMLERVGLGQRLDSRPTKLSGGEQQRVAIARALVRKPSLILADEPTGALDLDTGKVVMDLLEEIARENNAALVIITHDHKVAERAQKTYELYDGVLHPFTGKGEQA